MKRLVIVELPVRLIFHAVMLGSVFALFAGHNQPGGGFVGGLLAGGAIALRFVSGGLDEVHRAARAKPWTIIGAGLVLASVTALVPLVLGDPVLTTGEATLHPPLLGDVKLTSALAFDAGVYLVVLGLVLMVFEAFGDEPQREAALEEEG